MTRTGSPRRLAAHGAPAAVVAIAVLLGACAHPEAPQPEPPQRPPPPTTPARAPAQPPWSPRPDARAAATLADLDGRAHALIDAYNDLGEGDPRGHQLLVDAAALFEEAGRYGHAIRLLERLRKRAAARAEAENAATRVRALYLSMLSDRDAASTLHARACGATIIDPPPEASAAALLQVAACVDEDPLLFVVSLRYRRLAAERGAGPENDAQIEALEARRAKAEEAYYRKAAAEQRR